MDLVLIFVSVPACVHNHISDMCGPILFLLGTKTTPDGIHRHLILFHDAIKDGRLVAILLLKSVPNHFSDMHGPILFKLGTSTVHDGIHGEFTLFCDLIKDGRLVAILVVNIYIWASPFTPHKKLLKQRWLPHFKSIFFVVFFIFYLASCFPSHSTIRMIGKDYVFLFY